MCTIFFKKSREERVIHQTDDVEGFSAASAASQQIFSTKVKNGRTANFHLEAFKGEVCVVRTLGDVSAVIIGFYLTQPGNRLRCDYGKKFGSKLVIRLICMKNKTITCHIF